jgi:hypothetical protein
MQRSLLKIFIYLALICATLAACNFTQLRQAEAIPTPGIFTGSTSEQPQASYTIPAPPRTKLPSQTPTPTSSPTPIPTATLGPLGEIQPIPDGYVYLGDKDSLALGFNMKAGGAIGSLLINGRDVVDDTDYGRYIQLSFYDGNDHYGALGDDPYGDWGWNPIQSGSKAGGSSIVGAKVLEFRMGDGVIYIKSLGKEWGQIDQDSDVVFETWAWLRDVYFEIYTRSTHTGSDSHGLSSQEFPAAYFETSLTHEYGYFGDAPFTGAPIEELHQVANEGEYAGQGNCPYVYPTENWAAFGDADGFGLILASPPQTYLLPDWAMCLLYDQPRVGYISPLAYFAIPPQAVRESTYYLIPGDIREARSIVYDLIPHASWNFNLNSAEGWSSSAASLEVSDGVLKVNLSSEDYLSSRGDLLISGSIADGVSMNARMQEGEGEVCLEFITTSDAAWNQEKSKCLTVAGGDFQIYQFGMNDNPDWYGNLITQIRLTALTPLQLEVDSLQVDQNGYAWEFEKRGINEGWSAWSDLNRFDVEGGRLVTQSTGDDPYMGSPAGLRINADELRTIYIRMKISAGNIAQVFFVTDGDPEYDEAKSLVFTPTADGEFHTYSLDISTVAGWRGKVIQLRLDPTDQPSEIEIDYIRVVQ